MKELKPTREDIEEAIKRSNRGSPRPLHWDNLKTKKEKQKMLKAIEKVEPHQKGLITADVGHIIAGIIRKLNETIDKLNEVIDVVNDECLEEDDTNLYHNGL